LSFAKQIKKVKCPVIIFWSEKDQWVPEKFAKEYQSLFLGANLIMINGDHDWPFTKPKEILKYIKELQQNEAIS
jgi:surfactin synthase thioesterase subunit